MAAHGGDGEERCDGGEDGETHCDDGVKNKTTVGGVGVGLPSYLQARVSLV